MFNVQLLNDEIPPSFIHIYIYTDFYSIHFVRYYFFLSESKKNCAELLFLLSGSKKQMYGATFLPSGSKKHLYGATFLPSGSKKHLYGATFLLSGSKKHLYGGVSFWAYGNMQTSETALQRSDVRFFRFDGKFPKKCNYFPYTFYINMQENCHFYLSDEISPGEHGKLRKDVDLFFKNTPSLRSEMHAGTWKNTENRLQDDKKNLPSVQKSIRGGRFNIKFLFCRKSGEIGRASCRERV